MIKLIKTQVNVVSVFSSRQGIAIALEQFRNKESSEIAVVQALLATLQLEKVVFTFDSKALPKKTVQLIVEGGNDYVVAVKANQKRLYQQIQLNTQQTTPVSVDISTLSKERSRFCATTVILR